MKGQIGSKHYDTETADLVDTLPDGLQIYRKRGRSCTECFVFNPEGMTARQKFIPLAPEEAEKYLISPGSDSRRVFRSGSTVQFSPYDRDRIKRLANRQSMSMAQFILMLVDEYEQRQSEK